MEGELHCIDYKTNLKHQDFELVKNCDKDAARSKKYPVFNGGHGIKGLFYVEACFRKIATKFELDGEQLFDAFEDVLQNTALTNWEAIADEIVAAERDEDTFNNITKTLYLDYCDEKAGDSMQYDYLKICCKKPVCEEPCIHVWRVELLYPQAGKLPGMEALMMEDQIKCAIFKTFPESWKKQHVCPAKDIQTDTMQGIVMFVQNEKAYADADKKNNDKKRSSKSNGNDDSNKKKKKKDLSHASGGSKVQPND